MKMNKKVYKTPATKTIMLRQQITLLTESTGLSADRKCYGGAIEDTWGDE